LTVTVTPRFIDSEKKIGRIGVGLTEIRPWCIA